MANSTIQMANQTAAARFEVAPLRRFGRKTSETSVGTVTRSVSEGGHEMNEVVPFLAYASGYDPLKGATSKAARSVIGPVFVPWTFDVPNALLAGGR